MPNIDFVYFLGTPWDLFEVIQGGGGVQQGLSAILNIDYLLLNQETTSLHGAS